MVPTVFLLYKAQSGRATLGQRKWTSRMAPGPPRAGPPRVCRRQEAGGRGAVHSVLDSLPDSCRG